MQGLLSPVLVAMKLKYVSLRPISLRSITKLNTRGDLVNDKRGTSYIHLIVESREQNGRYRKTTVLIAAATRDASWLVRSAVINRSLPLSHVTALAQDPRRREQWHKPW